MVSSNYMAFGYMINKIQLEPGEVFRTKCKKYVVGDWYVVDSGYNPNLTRENYESGDFTYSEISLHVSGKVNITPMHTMVPVEYTRGHCNVDRPYDKGMVKEEVIETSVIFNITPFDNLNNVPVLPNVSVLRWSVGDIIEPPLRFFLADGSFSKGGDTYSTTGAYTLSVGSIEITSDCLGFIFN